jgi:hypothetical protein
MTKRKEAEQEGGKAVSAVSHPQPSSAARKKEQEAAAASTTSSSRFCSAVVRREQHCGRDQGRALNDGMTTMREG